MKRDEFWKDRSLDDLARLQGVSPITDPVALEGGFPDDEDIDAFLQDIYEARQRKRGEDTGS